MAKNRQCICCGEKYSYCPDCSRADKLAPSWKSQFCSEECMTLWMTLTRYNMGTHSKEEAKEIISALNLKPIDSYAACVKRDYAKVMHEEKKSRKASKKFEPIAEIELSVEQEIAEPVIEEPVVEEPTVHEVIITENE